MSTVPDLFNAVNNSVLSKYMNRMIKMENLLLEINALFESVKLLDPIEDRVKEIENQAKNCKYMFESNITEIIDECNNDIIQMGRRVEKLEEFRSHMLIKDGQNDAKMSLLELNITYVDMRIDNTVIPSFRKALEELNERISRLETKPCNFPETIVTALEGTMDAKIEASNQRLMNREGELFAKIREVVREIMNPT
jgi:hypothetical protein